MNKILLFLILYFVLSSNICRAESNIDIKVQIGFDGSYKVGFWFPVRLNLSNSASDFKGRVELKLISDLINENGQIYTSPIFLAHGTTSEILLYIFADKISQKLQIRLLDGSGKVIQNANFPLNFPSRYDEIFVLCLSSSRGEIDFLSNLSKLSLDNTTPSIRTFYMSDKQLLDRWKGYDPINLIVISDANLNLLQISDSQREALMEWLFVGGRILTAGDKHNLNLKSKFFQAILPVDIKEGGRRQATGGVKKTKIPINVSALRPSPSALRILSIKNVGMGKSLFLASDDPLYPMVKWDEKNNLWREIISDAKSNLPTTMSDREAASVLKTAVRRFPKPINSIAIFLCFYLICLSFLSYILNRRLKKTKFNWLAIPGLAMIFFFLASHVNAFSNVKASAYQISSWLIYPQSKMGSLYGYLSVFTPAKSKYQFGLLNSNRFFARSLSVEKLHPASQKSEFIQSSNFEISQSQMPIWSTKMLQFEAHIDWDMGDIRIKNLESDGQNVEVENLTSINLHDSILTFKDRYAKVGILGKGKKHMAKLTSIDSIDSIDSRSRLTELLGSSEPRRRFLKTLADIDSLIKPSNPNEAVVAGWSSDPNWMFEVNMGKRAKVDGETLVIIKLSAVSRQRKADS